MIYPITENYKTLHELDLMDFESAICDKPNWWEKLDDARIVARWRAEARSLCDNEFKYCMAELRWRAATWTEKFKPAGADGVFACDGGLGMEVQSHLVAAVQQLEVLQEGFGFGIDWHPHSNEQVRDLVHPSLYCYRRGRTAHRLKWLRREGEPLSTLTRHIGGGLRRLGSSSSSSFHSSEDCSKAGLVWLPSEFAVGQDRRVTIQSYINNLDPKQSPQLYTAIASVFQHLVPAFEAVLTVAACSLDAGLQKPAAERGRYAEAIAGKYDGKYAGSVSTGKERAIDERSGMSYTCPYYVDHEGEHVDFDVNINEEVWYDWNESDVSHRGHPIIRTKENPGPPLPKLVMPCTPPAEDFNPPEPAPARMQVDLRNRTLQVITKVGSIHLTPEKPYYKGGSWHVEGMVDESIVATGIYYFEQENITESNLAFRVAVDDPCYDQHDWEGVRSVYGAEIGENLNQHRGVCATLEGRCLAWPNTMQHQVQQFELKDKTKSGHRKILCFFLVDPNRHIVSTATCPPQQKAWFEREMHSVHHHLRRLYPLPSAVWNIIVSFVVCDGPGGKEKGKDVADDEKNMYMYRTAPAPPPVSGGPIIGQRVAKECRETLMLERGREGYGPTGELFVRAFNLCEH